MKFVTVLIAGTEKVALLDAEAGTVRPLAGVSTMLDLIERYEALKGGLSFAGDALPLESVSLLAPMPRPPRNIICVGKNYYDHAQEFADSGFDTSAAAGASAIPDAPIVFTKAPETVVAPGAAIVLPKGLSDQIDYEAELAVIIGKAGRAIPRAEAMDYVWGYSILNDVTARDLQQRHKQWFLGKSLDTFCPMGPWAVTADEADGTGLDVKCWVSGELRQQANTAQLIFDIPTLIETISSGLTLRPGDIIATGTPAGVGLGFDPPRFLAAGDVVEVEIAGLGRLVNPVI
ncbi:fumarylacetoacetate hydrolase family protein [Zavarzinia compransoris]|uniref:fumarylacetoacetate hydrolase family protein n=1 Tax=Zavarzinia marina TaxID=2911065 RepID=UPI001F46D628|nr:fumarylacetoacetate hydrolase family protein [Zavarzinia marina]MCF4167354.1 fumarylacetoacetate hydrolase family protein [Zavarzinia marina]